MARELHVPSPRKAASTTGILSHKGLFGKGKSVDDRQAFEVCKCRSLIARKKTAIIRVSGPAALFLTAMPRASVSGSLPTAPAPPASFEAALAELETLVANLEGGQLPLAEALNAYRRGAELLQFAQGQLQSAQEQVKILEGDLLKNFTEPESGAES